MRVEILGDERRRRWSDESKLEVVLSVGVDGASVTEVARRDPPRPQPRSPDVMSNAQRATRKQKSRPTD